MIEEVPRIIEVAPKEEVIIEEVPKVIEVAPKEEVIIEEAPKVIEVAPKENVIIEEAPKFIEAAPKENVFEININPEKAIKKKGRFNFKPSKKTDEQKEKEMLFH